jgi:hypothetical protein
MDLIRVRAALSSRTVWAILAFLFCLTIVMDFYVFAPRGSMISSYFTNRHALLRSLTYGFCLFVMLIVPHCIVSNTSVKNKVCWILLFFFTGFYGTEVYFLVRTITGWGASRRSQP